MFDGALLSLAYHNRSLGRSLGDAARGSPHDHASLDVQPCIGGVVYWGRVLAYWLQYLLYQIFCNTTEPQQFAHFCAWPTWQWSTAVSRLRQAFAACGTLTVLILSRPS